MTETPRPPSPTDKAEADKTEPGKRHWLYRAENLPKLWAIQILVLLLVLVPEFFIHHHPHFTEQGFGLDAGFGFYAWYGFLTCAGMVALAKVLGGDLKRKDSYYDE